MYLLLLVEEQVTGRSEEHEYRIPATNICHLRHSIHSEQDVHVSVETFQKL
jgi:hypothetical protein